MSKNEHQLITKAKRLFIVAVLAFFPLVSGCASNMQPSSLPLFVPFEAQKAGSAFTTEIWVVEHRIYIFAVALGVKKGATTEETIKNARQLDKLAGQSGRDENGKLYRPGISIPLKLKVSAIEPSDERIIYDKEAYEEEVISHGRRGIAKLIDSIELKRGRYRVSIQSLKNIPELVDNPITFGIYRWPNINPID